MSTDAWKFYQALADAIGKSGTTARWGLQYIARFRPQLLMIENIKAIWNGAFHKVGKELVINLLSNLFTLVPEAALRITAV